MSHFINNTLQDIRGGRENWRVVLFVSAPAFVISVGAAVLQNAF
jgi:hypothetical protein